MPTLKGFKDKFVFHQTVRGSFPVPTPNSEKLIHEKKAELKICPKFNRLLENPAKRRKLIALIKSLQEQRVPVMAISSQTHVSVSSPSFEQEDQAQTELETLGLPIHISELDVNCAQRGQRKDLSRA